MLLELKPTYYNDFWRITEDWSNDAENSALPSQKYITV